MLLDIETMTTFNCVTSYGGMEPPLCLSGLLNDWYMALLLGVHTVQPGR